MRVTMFLKTPKTQQNQVFKKPKNPPKNPGWVFGWVFAPCQPCLGPNEQKIQTSSSNIKKSNHTHPNGTVIFGFSMKLSSKWYTGLSYLHNVS